MKRVALISVVIAALLWIAYAGYELFFKNENQISPENIFCSSDEGVLLINRIQEVKSAEYLETVSSNELSSSLYSLDSIFSSYPDLKLYASAQRNLIILDNENYWRRKDEKVIRKFFPQANVNLQREGRYIMVSKSYSDCEKTEPLNIFIEADKKASANYWEFGKQGWKRTDVYNLNKGFFEYRSSDPGATYGKAINEVSHFSSVLPINISNYAFHERFYAMAQDSMFRKGPMSKWVDKGYITFQYRNEKVLCSDYRSKQQPSLILIEKTEKEDSVNVDNEIKSFTGFKLSSYFPSNSSDRIFVMEIEDKVFFATKKSTLQQLKIDYQLGKTIALNPTLKEELFGGLPTFANYRFVGKTKKMSLTWKEDLLFEVNTQPPHEQLKQEERTTWSYSPEFKIEGIIPIPDHLRKGTSALAYNDKGSYELIGPNGNKIWDGKVEDKIVGEIEVIDVFDNDKHQFLFRTEEKVHLVDLNGNEVGGFPYKSDLPLTSEISSFVWNGTKRFLVGTEKGEVIMLNSSGRELNIIQITKNPIINRPYALNIKGNLRSWAIDEEGNQFLGYLETPAKAEKLAKTSSKHFTKSDGTVIGYYEKEGEIFSQTIEKQDGKLIEKGNILKVDNDAIIINNGGSLVVLDHKATNSMMVKPSFNEINSIQLIQNGEHQFLLMMDYLKNKIYLFNELGEILDGFPKEGRGKTYSFPNEMSERLAIFTTIENSIVCYKVKL